MDGHFHPKVHRIENFSLFQKTFSRIGLYGSLALGIYGVFSESIFWGFAYMSVAILGTWVLLGRLCARYPYPYKNSNCLFLPFEWIKAAFRYRSEPMRFRDTLGLAVAATGLVAFPQYWLLKNPFLLSAFWIVCLPTLSVFPVYFCKRCRHVGCPLNLPGTGEKAAGFSAEES